MNKNDKKNTNAAWLTLDEVAERWGVSRATPYRLIRVGKLPATNFSAVGKSRARWRVAMKDLLEFERTLPNQRV